MAEVQIKLRYNPEAEEVELVVGDEVVGTSGQAEFASWVDNYNTAHPVEPVEPEETEEDRLRAELESKEAELEQTRADLAEALAAEKEAQTPPASDAPVAEVDSDESV